jgi:hypothetical protein
MHGNNKHECAGSQWSPRLVLIASALLAHRCPPQNGSLQVFIA